MARKEEINGVSNDHWVQMLNPTRSFEPNLDFDSKVKIISNGKVVLTAEKNTYRFLAGYHTKPINPLQLVVNPKYADDKKYHLGIISLATIILPVAVLSEVLNLNLYYSSIFKGEDKSLIGDTHTNFKNLRMKGEDEWIDAWFRLLFTALLGLYQLVRIPVLIAAVITALAIWLPQMIASFVMSTLVYGARPIWQPIANYAHEKQAQESVSESSTLSSSSHISSDDANNEKAIEAYVPTRKDQVSEFFGGLVYAFSKIFKRDGSGEYFKPDTPINTSDLGSDAPEDDSSSSSFTST